MTEERGMTLIEIMIVLAIIALVMGLLIGPKVIREYTHSRIKIAWMQTKEVADDAYPRWQADTGEACPSRIEELAPYVNKHDLKDPWNTTLAMRCDDSFGALSDGPDRRQDTPDDIHSWDPAPRNQ